ncbi:CpsD/CapB family tyrosine-protein kinase [Candidatus Poribacteria bacterium]|nr:CpsD/CapB family tyrosine-protein kinase [Candidatus Poribacteria bacterium]
MSKVYPTIVANVNGCNPEMDKQVLMLTRCNLSEDVHPVTAHLGAAVASVNRSVLMVDCNWSKLIQHQRLNVPLDAHVTHLLVDESIDWHQAIQHTHIPNLDLLNAGTLSSNPIDFLRLSRLNALFQQLRERYVLILLDAPPILPTADSLILSAHSDAAVLVVNLPHTTQDMLRTARERLVLRFLISARVSDSLPPIKDRGLKPSEGSHPIRTYEILMK